MEKLFIGFSKYFLLDGSQEELDDLKQQAGKMSGKYQRKASRYAKKLKKEVEKMGFEPDFESFCSMLENYVNIKDNISDEEKKNYLEILTKLSYIHEVDLRSELERYVSYKEIIPSEEDQKEIFHKFCRYYLNNNNSVEDYNELKDLIKQYNINFEEYQSEAISYIENLKNIAEELNLNIESPLEELVKSYNKIKKELTNQEKEKYLRLLTPLAYINNIELRDLLTIKEESKQTKEFTNPLDNDELIKLLLRQRYEEGSFNVKEIRLQEVPDSKEIDYPSYQAKLLLNIIQIYLDKYNNYCQNDLNENMQFLTDEDIYYLSNLTEEDIYSFMNEDDTRLSDTLIEFLNFAISTIDLRIEHIGTNEMSLFKTKEEQEDYTIYLNGPEKETIFVLNEYIKKCIQENISYNMTGLWSGGESTERSLLYSSEEDLPTKLSILDSILEEHPSWIETFGHPVLSSATNNSYYGISISHITNSNNTKEIPYNDYFNSVCEVAYYRTISKIVLNKITKEKDKEVINDFIELNNYQEDLLKLPEFSKYNLVDFMVIKDLINTYIPEISNTLNLYFENEEELHKLCLEFKKSIMYISNMVNNHPKKDKYNIALNIPVI